MTKIFLDMDGVIADFDKGLLRRGLVNETHWLHLPKEQWTEDQRKLDEQVKKVMAEDGFWYGLPRMSDAHKLWNFCAQHDHYVLTARPKDDSVKSKVEEEKWLWLTDHFGAFDSRRFIVCYRHEKKNFAGRNKVLVDDLKSNVNEWRQAGGHGILHTSAANSIRELKKIV